MAGVISSAVAAAHAAAAAVAGLPGKYRRGAGDCDVTLTPGRRSSIDDGTDGARNLSTLQEWILDPAELAIDAGEILPAVDDLVVLEDGTTYLVCPLEGEDVWRWTDQFQQRIRIHSVLTRPAGP
jgi:hypothetical protein